MPQSAPNKLPGFFTSGLTVYIDDNTRLCNAPGYSNLDAFPTDEANQQENSQGLALSRFILTHYHPKASHDEKVVIDLYEDCIKELMLNGGTIPHETMKDWLYLRGYKNDVVTY